MCRTSMGMRVTRVGRKTGERWWCIRVRITSFALHAGQSCSSSPRRNFNHGVLFAAVCSASGVLHWPFLRGSGLGLRSALRKELSWLAPLVSCHCFARPALGQRRTIREGKLFPVGSCLRSSAVITRGLSRQISLLSTSATAKI